MKKLSLLYVFLILLWCNVGFAKEFKSIFGFSFELPNNYELLAILDGKQILSALESDELRKKINENFNEAVDLSKSIVPDVWKLKIERYSSQGKIALQTGEGIATTFMGLKKDMEKDGFVKEDLEFLCTDEYHEMLYQTKIPVHECKFINIPNDAEWSFIMVADSTFDVTQGISEKKRRRQIRAQFLIKDSVFAVVGFCKPKNCEKIRKDVDQVLSTISY